MIKRIASKRLKHLFSMFKVVAVTGPRQSGKTTLVNSVFPNKPYITLENPDNRQFAIDDPRGFLSQFPAGLRAVWHAGLTYGRQAQNYEL